MLADRIITYYKDLHFDGDLPDGITMLNPMKENPPIQKLVTAFYKKYYNDNQARSLILGINPGRLGAGATGIPFTDTKRLQEYCGIEVTHMHTHEPSSVFVYEVINAYGGPEIFYNKFYINSVCPLGFTITNLGQKEVNYNYYDSKALQEAIYDFIRWNIREQINMGCKTDTCYCLGTGKNFAFLKALNGKEKYFDKIIPLDHPRYVMQYKSKSKTEYIDKYLQSLL